MAALDVQAVTGFLVGLLIGVPSGVVLLAVVLAWCERDAGAKGYVDMTLYVPPPSLEPLPFRPPYTGER